MIQKLKKSTNFLWKEKIADRDAKSIDFEGGSHGGKWTDFEREKTVGPSTRFKKKRKAHKRKR